MRIPARSFQPVFVLFFSGLFVILAVHLWAAWVLRIEYFDNYSVLMNARSMLGGNPDEFYWKRFIFLPVLLSPLFLLERLFFAHPFGFVASHFAVLPFYPLLIWVSYRIVRLDYCRLGAVAAAGILALNPLLIHYAPFAKEDIPAAFLMASAFFFYLRTTKKGKTRDYVLTAVCLAAAALTRYNLLPVLFGVIAFHQLMTGGAGFRLREGKPEFTLEGMGKKLFFYLALPLAFFFLFPALVYGSMGIVSFWEGPQRILTEIGWMRQMNMKPEPSWQNYAFLVRTVSLPLFAAGIIGLIRMLRRRSRADRFYLAWFAVVFLFQTYVIQNKEARYLLPLYPAFCLMILNGLVVLRHAMTGKESGLGRRLWPLVLALMLVLPFREAVAQLMRFSHPVYRSGYAEKVARFAEDLAGDRKIYWVGSMYPLHDTDYVFHEEDENTYMYHIYNHTIRFYTRKTISGFTGAQFAVPGGPADGVFPLGIANAAEDGDVLIVSVEPSGYDTGTLPENLKPLFVQKLRMIDFPGDASAIRYPGLGLSDAVIEVNPGEAGAGLKGSGIPDGFYELYFIRDGHSAAQLITLVRVEGGELLLQGQGELPEDLRGIRLVGYSRVRVLPHP